MINRYILVADDDPNIRTGLTRELEKEFGQAATILSCENGAMASNIIQYQAVDILITDIKMPVMNGIELLQFIHSRSISCKSVVLSGFDDFNLVRDAMRCNAVDYLLKPVDFGLLNDTICHLLSEAASRDEITDAAFINRQRILEYYIRGGMDKTEEILVFEEKYNLTGSSRCTAGCVKLRSIHAGQAYELQNLLKNRLNDILQRLHYSDVFVLTGNHQSLWVFLLIFPEGRSLSEDDLTILQTELSQAEKQLQISGGDTTLSAASKAIKECMEGFESAFYDLPYRNIPADAQAAAGQMDTLLSRSVAAVTGYQTSEALQHLTSLFALLNHQKPSVNHVKRLFTNFIYSIINENSKFIEPVSNTKFTEYDIFSQIETAESLSDLQKNLFASLNHLIEEILTASDDSEDYIIQTAIDYIRRNYNDCITLNNTAAHVYLNKNYFSALFKSRTGTTYREYLRDYRIKEAIRLMKESDMKIYEIAQAVGYNDSAHFIRAFKEVTGKSPSAYKEA